MNRSRVARVLTLLSACATLPLAGCHHASAPVYTSSATAPAIDPPRAKKPVVAVAIPKPPVVDTDEAHGKPISTEIGLASWYGPPYHNRKGADGTVFDENALTAAHRTLPMGSTVRVTNLATNQSVLVRITDRGPFVPGRTLDLSLAAAKEIGLYRMGVAKVKVEAYAHASADPAGRWCVQVGVFIDPADAVQLKNDLASRYKTAKVIEFAGPTGHWVRINPALADHATAEKIADAIHLPDAEPYLIRTN